MLAAIVLGYELAGHIIDAVPDARVRGFHGSTRAIFAATGAAARLLRLDAEQTTHAIGLAATSAGGLAKAADTSVAREYNCGNATLLGIQAAQAAQRGYTCEERVLEMKQGYFEAFGGTDGEAASRLATSDLGHVLGHRDRHGRQAGARRASVSRAGRGRRQRGARGQHRGRTRSRASPCRAPA